MKKNYETFLSGKDALSLEQCLIQKFMEIDEYISQIKKNQENVEMLVDEKQYAYSKIGLMHYDAFGEDVRGKLSFCMAILNESPIVLFRHHTKLFPGHASSSTPVLHQKTHHLPF